MSIIFFLFLIPVVYGLLFWLWPKGNLLYEGLHLLPYLWRTKMVDVSTLLENKHRFGSHRRQYLLHFFPKENTPPRSQVIIYLHGGAWQFGRPEMFRANAKVFTDVGYHVFCLSYRRLPFHHFEAIHQDVSSGLQMVIQLMDKHRLTNKKIMMGGMSAGGHLVAMLLYDRENLKRLGIGRHLFSGLFLCGAPLDLHQMTWTPSLYFLAGREGSPSFRRANPIELLQTDEQHPVLIFHGTKDGLAAYGAGVAFAERLKKINPQLVELHTLENGSHLDAGRWVMQDDWVRKKILAWVREKD